MMYVSGKHAAAYARDVSFPVGLTLVLGAAGMAGCSATEDAGRPVPLLRLEEVATYGSMDAAGASLSNVIDVARGPDEVFVLEWSPPRVAVFGLDGSWVRDIGRAGQGPGEFRTPTALGLTEDRIWVHDRGARSLEVFDADGTHVASHRWDIPPDSGIARALPVGFLRGGAILAGPAGLSIGALASGALRSERYYRTDEVGRIDRLLYSAMLDPTDAYVARTESGVALVGMNPLRRSTLVGSFRDGSGLAVVEQPTAEDGDSAAYRLQVISEVGTIEVDLLVAYVPRSADGWLEGHLEEMERRQIALDGEPAPEFLDAVRENMPERDFHPPVTKVLAADDGSVWVRREEGADSVEWDVFDRSGALLHHVRIPLTLDVLRPSLADVWAVRRDRLDVPFVVRLRVASD